MSITETYEVVTEHLSEYEELYNKIAKEFKLHLADNVTEAFREMVATRRHQSMTDEEVREHSVAISTEIYRLGTILARQGLRANIVKIYYQQQESKSFTNSPVPEDGKKLTREDKAHYANIKTEAEQQISAIYEQVFKAVEHRLWGLKEIYKTVEAINYQNQSEKRMTRNDN